METSHLLHTNSLSCSPSFHHHRHRRPPPIMPYRKRSPAFVTAVLTPPADPSLAVEETNTAERYKDSWFDRIAIHYLSQSVQAASGLRNDKGGFESLVEAATAVSRNYDTRKQRELVTESLDKAFPKPILSLIRRVMVPKHKLTREFFALFTTLFFAWLVGPCEVRESERNGRREKNVVYIKKCRFLDETKCVGMCTNLCKIPSQSFINHSLGMAVNMVPNFEDMSCQMIFGEEPPPLMEDPALTQPCYKLCRANLKHHKNCSS